MSLFVWFLESFAARGGCVVDTAYEALVAPFWHAVALQYADQLSSCARAFFGV